MTGAVAMPNPAREGGPRRRLGDPRREHLRADASAARRASAVVVVQWMQAVVSLNAETGLRGRKAVLQQLRLALRLYLDALARRR